MPDALTTLLYRLANWRAALLITLLYALFLTQVMAPQGALMTATAGDWGAPDGHLFYTPETLYKHISSWNAEAQSTYIDFRFGLDPLWALVYGSWLIAFTGIGLRHSTRPGSPRRLLILLPLIPVVADLGENLLGIALVSALPEPRPLLAWLTAGITATKWLTLAAAHAVTLLALTAAAASRLRHM